MNLRELEYIIAIDEERNLTRAAEKVSVTPSALTQKLNQLESDVEVPLFTRSRKGLEPTAAGLRYIEAARQILQIKKDLYNELHDMADIQKGVLNVGIFPEKGSEIFSAIYPEFHRAYPDVILNLMETHVKSQQKMISEGRLDMGLMTLSDDQRTEDEYILISRQEILVAFPASYPLDNITVPAPDSRYPVVDMEKLRYEPFALISKLSTFRYQQERIFKKHGIDPKILFESSKQNSILDMVSSRFCLALVTDGYIDSPHAEKVRFAALPDHPCWNVMVSYKKGSYLSDVHKYLIRLFREYELGRARA